MGVSSGPAAAARPAAGQLSPLPLSSRPCVQASASPSPRPCSPRTLAWESSPAKPTAPHPPWAGPAPRPEVAAAPPVPLPTLAEEVAPGVEEDDEGGQEVRPAAGSQASTLWLRRFRCADPPPNTSDVGPAGGIRLPAADEAEMHHPSPSFLSRLGNLADKVALLRSDMEMFARADAAGLAAAARGGGADAGRISPGCGSRLAHANLQPLVKV